ncbi:hypothetical protein ACH4TX_42230 [Streptomyces sp. NPDC021098]|uniref:hypothetical protein n=1 Tax=unclassified Streptomyces TaxID=2593676 RepID=UPI0037B7D867
MTDRPPYDGLLARLEKERAHHQSCAALSRTDEGRIAHSGMAAGFLHAAIHLVKESEGPGAARQYMERATTEAGVVPAATPEPSPDDTLREEYAAAARRLGHPSWEADELAAAIGDVRDRRMEQLVAGRATWKAKALETERDRDRIAAERDQTRALAPMFEGLESLLATSSKDWGACREDAWLWAVLVGWDCEEDHEHNATCDDGGAMQEIAERYGWSPEAVAKARRYRAAVRAVLDGQVEESS